MSTDIHTTLQQILLPPKPRPAERGVIALVHRSNGFLRRTLLIQDVVIPREGEVTFDIHGLQFSPAYKSRATDAAAVAAAGIIFIHTHPALVGSTANPRPSNDDLTADARDLYALGQTLRSDAPLAAGIMNDAGRWSVREYAFRFPRSARETRNSAFGIASARMSFATAVRVVGTRLIKTATDVSAPGPAGAQGATAPVAQDSSIRLWGEIGQRALASLRVGLAGAGGVGSILAEHLARLGVGQLVIVDFDRYSSDVANRTQGATRQDAKERRLKVDLAARAARRGATAPEFRAFPMTGSVVEAPTMPYLLDCDVILNAADSPWARQVLDHLAFAHLIPVIHGGTLLAGDAKTGALRSGKAEVSATGPGQACSQCANVYSIRDVTDAQEAPDVRGPRGYVRPGEPTPEIELRAPSVIAFNALVAGLMELRLLAIAIGTTPDAIVGVQRYYPIEGTLGWGAIRACKTDCSRREITAFGDTYPLPLGRDLDRAARASAAD